MKTVSKIFGFTLMMTLSLATIAGTGNEGKTAKMDVRTSINNDKVYVTYVSKDRAKIEVQIRDAKGRVISSDMVDNKEGFQRPYNIAQLKDGKYTVRMLENRALVYESEFIINSKNTAVMALGAGKYQVTYSDKTEQEVAVTIYDEQGVVLHEDKIAAIEGFSRVYDLSKFADKHLAFEIKTAKGIKNYKF